MQVAYETKLSRRTGKMGLFAVKFIAKDTLIWKYADANKTQFSEAEVKELEVRDPEAFSKLDFTSFFSPDGRLIDLRDDDTRHIGHSTKPNIASGWVLAEAAAQRSSAATTAGKDATEGGAGGAAAATGNGCRTDATTEAAADDNSSADNLYALRDIKEGMELLEDYNTYGEDPEWYRRLTMERVKWMDEAKVLMEGLDELRLTITKERKPGVAKLPDSRRSSVTSPIDAKEYTYERGGGGGFGGGGGGGGVAGGNDVNGSISEDGDAFAAAAGVGGDAIASTSASAASSDAIAASSTVGRRSSRSTSISTSSSREWFGSEFYIEVQAYILEFVPWVDLLRGISQTCKVLNELVWTSRRLWTLKHAEHFQWAHTQIQDSGADCGTIDAFRSLRLAQLSMLKGDRIDCIGTWQGGGTSSGIAYHFRLTTLARRPGTALWWGTASDEPFWVNLSEQASAAYLGEIEHELRGDGSGFIAPELFGDAFEKLHEAGDSFMVAGHIQWFLAEETTATAKAALDYYFPDANRRSAPAATGLTKTGSLNQNREERRALEFILGFYSPSLRKLVATGTHVSNEGRKVVCLSNYEINLSNDGLKIEDGRSSAKGAHLPRERWQNDLSGIASVIPQSEQYKGVDFFDPFSSSSFAMMRGGE